MLPLYSQDVVEEIWVLIETVPEFAFDPLFIIKYNGNIKSLLQTLPHPRPMPQQAALHVCIYYNNTILYMSAEVGGNVVGR